MRLASEWIRSCHSGETLSVSAQRKAAEARAATKARKLMLLFIEAGYYTELHKIVVDAIHAGYKNEATFGDAYDFNKTWRDPA